MMCRAMLLVMFVSACSISNAGTVTWEGAGGAFVGDGTNWSDGGNWDTGIKPGVGDDVVFNRTTSNITSTMDEDFIVDSLTWSGVFGTITINGSNNLTAATYTKPTMSTTTNVPLVLNQTTTFNANGGGGWSFNGDISETGGARKVVLAGGDQLRLTGNNSFSGGVDINAGALRFQDSALGSGPIELGSGGGSGNASLFPDLNGSYTNSTNTVTVKAGTGNRDIFNQLSSANVDLPLNFVLEKDLRLRMGSNDTLTMSGSASGAGGLLLEQQLAGGETELTTRFQVNLSGTNSYLGTTTLSGKGTATLTSSLANGNIVIQGDPAALNDPEAIFNGTGTIVFNDGDLISVNSTGRLDATDLQFDLTNLDLETLPTLVDYTNGAFDGPASLNDLLTASSLFQGWQLTNTGNLITAAVVGIPEPASGLLLGLGLIAMLRLKRRRQQVVC